MDTCEAISNCIHAEKSPTFQSTSAPYDDPDASLPLVIGQTLTHKLSTERGDRVWHSIKDSTHSVQSRVSDHSIKDRSPPGRPYSQTFFVISSVLPHYSSLQTLAPPLR